MRRQSLLLLSLAAGLLQLAAGPVAVCRAAIEDVKLGSTEEDVYVALGAPNGQMKGDGYVVLFYDGGHVELREGKVARIDPKFRERAALRQRAESSPSGWLAAAKEKAAQVYARVTGSPFSATAQPAAPVVKTPPPPGGPPIKTISDEGRAVDLGDLLVHGRVTIVDFYADWCWPCRKIGPKLELIARQDGEVCLRKVDIVNWGTDVAKQFEIDAIPHIRVYNREGQMIGTPTSDFDQVVQYVAAAK